MSDDQVNLGYKNTAKGIKNSLNKKQFSQLLNKITVPMKIMVQANWRPAEHDPKLDISETKDGRKSTTMSSGLL